MCQAILKFDLIMQIHGKIHTEISPTSEQLVEKLEVDECLSP